MDRNIISQQGCAFDRASSDVNLEGPEAAELPTSGGKPEQTPTAAWKEIVAKYQVPSTGRASWQLINTLGPYALLWWLMHWSLGVSWWLTVPLAILAGGFMVRIFIIFHDCGHGSYLGSRTANDLVGFITGILTFTPYYHWRWEHAIHHASSGHLDRRGTGDVWTLTVQEYLEASRWKRFAYRLARNPIILFVIAPLFLFLLRQRFPTPGANKRERHSVYMMNIAIFAMATGLVAAFGLEAYLLIQLIVVGVAGSAGVWLFYVQHQFEGTYWERGDNWDFTKAALEGSSFYKLPKILQWFSGNIGFHHIHHLSARIPNYNLERCHKADPLFQQVKPVTLFGSFKSLTFRLWDEQRRKLVGYRHVHELRKQQKQKEAAERIAKAFKVNAR
ncbi:MAG TPA: fatty acid desaturase [Verrucomicrobiae bacterium]|jgi:omega-6 fatty acid desaturase (delta-12 desaturase)|nr:fatty acid desaturase [Verrucomicrobiae bacterium]